MKILQNYVARNVLSATALVVLILVGLQIFILMVNQLGDLGKADFGIIKAGYYVLLQLPYQIYLFFPIACLLGALIGLGLLANTSELVVMRASGMSIGQITLAVFRVAVVLIVLVTILGETLVPKLSRYAHDIKMDAVTGGQSLRTSRGLWLRQNLDFINVSTILPEYTMQNVNQFRLRDMHQLAFVRHMKEIRYENNQWVAYDVEETQFTPNKTIAKKYPKMAWDVPLKPEFLSISSVEPDEMSLGELYQFLQLQKNSYQNVQNYQLAFWQRLIQPFTTLVMMLLAIPFIFGPLRSSSMGAKLLAGATVGFGFHIINKFMGPVSFVFQWPVLLAAIGPTIAFAIFGIYLMRKMK